MSTLTPTGDSSDDLFDAPPVIERPDETEWRTIEDSEYFSASLKRQAQELAHFDESYLISNMSVLNDNDHSAMQTVLTEFRWCQHLIAEMESNPNEVTYGNFMTGMTALFHAVEQYTGTSDEAQALRLGSAAAAATDTGIEKSAIGLRIKFLIAQLKEMTQPLAMKKDFFRTTLAQKTAHKLFGMERQQEVKGYLKQAENIYGSKGLKYRSEAKQLAINAGRTLSSPISNTNAMIGNIRTHLLRWALGVGILLVEIGGAGYVLKETAGASWNYLRSGNATAPEDPSTDPKAGLQNINPALMKQVEALDQAEVDRIFQGMDVEVKSKNLHVKFADTGALTVNETLFVLMGTGTEIKVQHANPIGNDAYTIPLSPGQLQKSTEIAVTIRGKSQIGSQNFLLPMVNGEAQYKMANP